MGNGAEQFDESFFRKYRELLDAEDTAFDELEHAYEDGDRAHWADDLAAWQRRGREARRVPRQARPGPGVHLAEPRRGSLTRTRPTNSSADADHPVDRPTKKWLAPITSTWSFSTSRLPDHVGRVAELVVLAEDQVLGAGVGATAGSARRAAAVRTRASAATRSSSVRERHVGAERPAHEQHGHVAAADRATSVSTAATTSSRSPCPRRARPGCAPPRGS